MIIVTGGAGFIGSAFVWRLNQAGISDVLIVDDLNTSEKWRNLLPLKYTRYIHKNDFLALLESGGIGEIEAIVHMGAQSSTTEQDMDYLMVNNVGYTQRLARYCLKKGIRFVYASSAATYGEGEHGFGDDHAGIEPLQPINRYGYSKQLLDLWALREGVLDQMVGVKFFNVYGPNEAHKGDMKSLVCKAYSQILETGTLKLFKSYREEFSDGGQMRDFVYVKDCVDVLYWLLQNTQVNGIFNVGTGTPQTWNDLADAVFRAMGRETNITYIEMPEAIRDQYQYYTEADISKLQAAGYSQGFMDAYEGAQDYVGRYLTRGMHLGSEEAVEVL